MSAAIFDRHSATVFDRRLQRLLAVCDSLNDERGTGGQSKLACLVGWHYSTVWRKLNGKSDITKADELAVKKAFEQCQAADNSDILGRHS